MTSRRYASTEQAEDALADLGQVLEDRDEIIRAAVRAGVTKHRAHVLTGIARTTIDRIVAGEEPE